MGLSHLFKVQLQSLIKPAHKFVVTRTFLLIKFYLCSHMMAGESLTPVSWRVLPTDSWFLLELTPPGFWIFRTVTCSLLWDIPKEACLESHWGDKMPFLHVLHHENTFREGGRFPQSWFDEENAHWCWDMFRRGKKTFEIWNAKPSHGQITWDKMFFPLGSTCQVQTSHLSAALHNLHHTKPQTWVKHTTNM